MASGSEKAFSVSAFHETKSVVTVQRQYRQNYGKSSPNQPSVRSWYKLFVTDDLCVKAKAPTDTDGFLFVVCCEGQYLRPAAADITTLAQNADQRGLCKH
jgi:hypothetical protein